MKLIYIVGIILILTFPVSSGATINNSSNNHYISTHDYNFTSLQIGSFPVNKSWIGFRSFNLASPSAISVESNHGTRGLQVSTYGYNGVGNQFLNLSMNSNKTFSLKVTFSWNYNNSNLKTGNIFELNNGSTANLNYHFGPLYSKNTFLVGHNSTIMGPDPSTNTIYTLDITWDGNPSLIYTNILKGWNKTMNLPVAVKPQGMMSEHNISMAFGGAYSNITIYNIFLNGSLNGFNVPNYSPELYFNNETIDTNIVGLNSSSPGFLPIVDGVTNSIIYSGNTTNPGIYDYNFYNNTSRQIYSLPSGYLETTSSTGGGYAYFLFGNESSSSMLSINLDSLNVKIAGTEIAFKSGTHILTSANSAYLIAKNGTLDVFNNNDGNLNQSVFAFHNFGTIASSGNLNGNLTVSFFNNTLAKITRYELMQNGVFHSIGTFNNVVFDGSTNINTGIESLPTYTEYPTMNQGYDETVLIGNNGSEPMIFTENYSIARSPGTIIPLEHQLQVFAVSGSNIYPTNIAAGSSYLYISKNLSFGLGIYGNSVVLYYNGSTPYSGDNISVGFNPPSVLTGNVSLNYSVKSQLNYSVKAVIGNMSLVPIAGKLDFSSYRLTNGTYNLTITAENTAGYATSETDTIHVDNFIPIVSLDPANGSVVLENSSLTVDLTGISGKVSSTVQFGSGPTAVFQGDSFETYFPAAKGNYTVLLEVTDEFGITRSYTYFYEVENVNSSGYHSNIIPGSFLSSGALNLTWSRVKFGQHYNVSVSSENYSYITSTAVNFTKLNLSSGTYDLVIKALLDNSSWIRVVNESFTVQLYNPELELNDTPDHYYSFYGDSTNDTLNITANSNVSVSLQLVISEGRNIVFESEDAGNALSLELNSTFSFLRSNGLYSVHVTATEGSGRTSAGYLNFSVNNTVPSAPAEPAKIYTNNTQLRLNLAPSANESISYYYSNGTLGGYILTKNSTIKLYKQHSEISLEVATSWGNHNVTSITVIQSAAIPEINVSVSSSLLVWNNSLRLSYSIQDPVNLSYLSIEMNNRTVYNSTANTGSINMTLQQDGNYTLYIETQDLSGNHNETNISGIVCDYYPSISDLRFTIAMFMGFAHLSSTVTGKDLESVNYSWTVDGSYVSGNREFYTILMPGTHNITFEARYHGTTIESAHQVFTLGFLPELTAFLGFAGILAYRKYSGEDDEVTAEDIILENIGLQRREILAIARKRKIRVKTVETVITELASSGKIRLMPDPDNVMYVMGPKK